MGDKLSVSAEILSEIFRTFKCAGKSIVGWSNLNEFRLVIGQVAKNPEMVKANKWYLAFQVEESSFMITNEKGGVCFCLPNSCGHLDGGDWEIKELSMPEKQVVSILTKMYK